MADDLHHAAQRVARAIERARYKPRDIIPILDSDPDFEDGITLWMDPNGNLRSYGPNGTKYQYAKTAVTAASGSFPVDPQPEMFTTVYSAVWARVFCSTHGVESPTFAGYGDDPAGTHGYRRVMIGFPDATIRANTDGATIDSVELSFTNVDANGLEVTLHVGWHNQTAAPAVWAATRSDTVLLDYPKVGTGELWRPVDDVFGTALRDNIYKGLTIEQPAGWINAGAIDWAATQIRISYTD